LEKLHGKDKAGEEKMNIFASAKWSGAIISFLPNSI